MAEVFELLPDGSGQFVEIRLSLLSFEAPQRIVVKTVDAKTVAAIREVLVKELAAQFKSAEPAPVPAPVEPPPVEVVAPSPTE
jgi:hypothetical protein